MITFRLIFLKKNTECFLFRAINQTKRSLKILHTLRRLRRINQIALTNRMENIIWIEIWSNYCLLAFSTFQRPRKFSAVMFEENNILTEFKIHLNKIIQHWTKLIAQSKEKHCEPEQACKIIYKKTKTPFIIKWYFNINVMYCNFDANIFDGRERK